MCILLGCLCVCPYSHSSKYTSSIPNPNPATLNHQLTRHMLPALMPSESFSLEGSNGLTHQQWLLIDGTTQLDALSISSGFDEERVWQIQVSPAAPNKFHRLTNICRIVQCEILSRVCDASRLLLRSPPPPSSGAG